MWRALKAPYSGRPAETGSPEVWPAIPTRDNSGLKQFNRSRALSCQLVQGIFHPFGEGGGAGRLAKFSVPRYCWPVLALQALGSEPELKSQQRVAPVLAVWRGILPIFTCRRVFDPLLKSILDRISSWDLIPGPTCTVVLDDMRNMDW